MILHGDVQHEFSPGKLSSIKRWVRLHKCLTDDLTTFLKANPRLPSYYVLDNSYLTGNDTKQRLSDPYGATALELLVAELAAGKSYNAAKFQADICRPVKKVEAQLWIT